MFFYMTHLGHREQCGELAEGDNEVVKHLPQLIMGSH